MAERTRIAIISRSDFRGGADLAASRLNWALNAYVSEKCVAKLFVGTCLDGSQNTTSGSRLSSELKPFHRLGQVLALWTSRAYRLAYRITGGRATISFASGDSVLLTSLREFAPDVILVNWLGDDLISLEGISSFSCPIIWRLADHWLEFAPYHYSPPEVFGLFAKFREWFFAGRKQELLKRRLQQSVFGPRAALMAPSKAALGELSLPVKKNFSSSSVILNTLNFEEWQPHPKSSARMQLGVDSEALVVLVGAENLLSDPRKGFVPFRAEIRKQSLSTVSRPIEFHFFGGGRTGALSENEFHHGKVTAHEMRLLFSASDVFVAPSIQETFGNTVLEALACGCPVIAFEEVGAHPDLISHGDNGLLAPRSEFDQLVSELGRALKDPAWLLQAGLRAREIAIDRCSPRAVANEFIDFASGLTQEVVK